MIILDHSAFLLSPAKSSFFLSPFHIFIPKIQNSSLQLAPMSLFSCWIFSFCFPKKLLIVQIWENIIHFLFLCTAKKIILVLMANNLSLCISHLLIISHLSDDNQLLCMCPSHTLCSELSDLSTNLQKSFGWCDTLCVIWSKPPQFLPLIHDKMPPIFSRFMIPLCAIQHDATYFVKWSFFSFMKFEPLPLSMK